MVERFRHVGKERGVAVADSVDQAPDLRSLRPLDMDPVYASVSKTHRAVVVQEQWKLYGAAAEIAASITEAMFDELDAPVARVTGEDVPMPYARNLELLATPHEEHIARAVKKVMYANG